MKQQNNVLATKNVYSLFDCCHRCCGGSIAAIRAGIFVKAGADNVGVAIRQFEDFDSRCMTILKIEHALSLCPFTIQWQKRLLPSGAGQTKEAQLGHCIMMVASVLAK